MPEPVPAQGDSRCPHCGGALLNGFCSPCNWRALEPPIKVSISIAEQEQIAELRHRSYLLALKRRHIQR